MFVKLYKILVQVLTAVSFLLLFPALGLIAYNSIVCCNISRVVAGAILLVSCIHLNKSL